VGGAVIPKKLATEASLKRIFLNFLSDESGATAIEYGLIAAGIALAIVAAVNSVGSSLSGLFTTIGTSLK
jgi:pilus assembly protein Flp/PilA